jgi:hypothetical protein
MNINNNVSSVSKNAVLNVFPIGVLNTLDGTPGKEIQLGLRAKHKLILGASATTANEKRWRTEL